MQDSKAIVDAPVVEQFKSKSGADTKANVGHSAHHHKKTDALERKEDEKIDPSLIVPLPNLVANIPEALVALHDKPCADEKHDDYALFAALVFTLLSTMELWNALADAIREKLCIGLIKETINFGNTSVSMGAAVTSKHKCVVFLNCGTGGIKWQLYYRKNGVYRLVDEFKPKNGASPNALSIGSHAPKNAVEFALGREKLEKEYADARKYFSKYNLPIDTPFLAFVTGTLRQCWEEADAEGRTIYETKMVDLFATIASAFSTSFFISQDDEGKLELIGARQLYSNLVKAGQLEEGTKVIGSFGIGKGSVQWTILNALYKEIMVGLQVGMNKAKELKGSSKAMIAEMIPEEGERPFDDLVAMCKKRSNKRPTIAWKSGCLLLLDNPVYADIKKILLQKPRNVVEVEVVKEDAENDVEDSASR